MLSFIALSSLSLIEASSLPKVNITIPTEEIEVEYLPPVNVIPLTDEVVVEYVSNEAQ